MALGLTKPCTGVAASVLQMEVALGTVLMDLEFNGKLWYWRGPAPWYFITVPAKQCRDLKAVLKFVTYGWGMIPVNVQIGKTEWRTSLFPKDGRYVVPIKASVRKAENLEEGDKVIVRLEVRL